MEESGEHGHWQDSPRYRNSIRTGDFDDDADGEVDDDDEVDDSDEDDDEGQVLRMMRIIVR